MNNTIEKWVNDLNRPESHLGFHRETYSSRPLLGCQGYPCFVLPLGLTPS